MHYLFARGYLAEFQFQADFPSHFTGTVSSIAWEARLCNSLRGALFLADFGPKSDAFFQTIFASSYCGSHARGHAQKLHHCAPRGLLSLAHQAISFWSVCLLGLLLALSPTLILC